MLGGKKLNKEEEIVVLYNNYDYIMNACSSCDKINEAICLVDYIFDCINCGILKNKKANICVNIVKLLDKQ